MRLIRLILLLVTVTFLFGWATHVYYGNMSTKRYVGYYLDNLQEFVGYFKSGAQKSMAVASKPIVRHEYTFIDY